MQETRDVLLYTACRGSIISSVHRGMTASSSPMSEKRCRTTPGETQGMSQAQTKRRSPDAASAPAWSPPIGPLPFLISVTHRTPSRWEKRLHWAGSLATRTISSTTPPRLSTSLSMKVRPSIVKKYFSWPFARLASPPTRIIADRPVIRPWRPDRDPLPGTRRQRESVSGSGGRSFSLSSPLAPVLFIVTAIKHFISLLHADEYPLQFRVRRKTTQPVLRYDPVARNEEWCRVPLHREAHEAG